MKRFHACVFFLAILLCLASQLPTQAGIVYSGDLSPTNPNSWTSDTTASIGSSGTGQVEVNGGSDLLSRTAYLGSKSGIPGTVTVTGAGSTWSNSSNLYIGTNGSGTLSITNGGAVSSSGGSLGSYSGSTGVVNVDGTGSTWTNSGGFFRVGNYGNGTLSITNGGAVSNNYGFLGCYSGSTGVVTVDGSGSTWTNSNYLYVGHKGNGTLNITNGGTANIIGNTYVAYYDSSTSSINFGASGGTLTTKSFMASPSRLFGTGVINANGIVSDYDLVLDSTASLVQTLTIGGSGQDRNITVNLDMSGYDGNLGVNHGSLTINGIAVNSEYGYIGFYSGSTGIVTVDGTGSTWNNRGLNVGQYGNGTLSITNGGTIDSNNWDVSFIGFHPGSTGTVTVDGTGSTWNNGRLYLGHEGNGTLNIINGGAVNMARNAYVDVYDSSTSSINFGANGGTLTTQSLVASSAQLFGTGVINANGIVSDYDLVFDSTNSLNQTFTIGGSGQDRNITVNLDISGVIGNLGVNHGSMTINGIAVDSLSGYIGYYSGSTGTVTVDGAGSIWANCGGGTLYVGHYGNGTLSITNGGTVSSSNHYIGKNSGSTGVVTVDGAGSTWNTDESLYLGDYGSGTLSITNGGTVNNGTSCIGYKSGSTGVVTVDGNGSTWNNSGGLYVGYEGDGTLSITNGGLVSVAGTLIIDYDTDGDSFINMSDGGMLALWGDADDSLAMFLNLIDGSHAIRWWDPDAIPSGWHSLSSATMGDDYTLEYFDTGDLAGYTLLTVTAIEPGPGDANCDGKVDSSDLGIMANNWTLGVPGGDPSLTWSMGDFNGDYRIDSSDLGLLANHWLSGVGLSQKVVVPEPGSVALLLTLVAVGMVVRVRKLRR